jgi:hypothetical protein
MGCKLMIKIKESFIQCIELIVLANVRNLTPILIVYFDKIGFIFEEGITR